MTGGGGAVPLAMLAYCDLGALLRGRMIPACDVRPGASVGWVPSALARPPFGPSIRPNPFGAIGDVRLLADVETRTRLPEDEAGNTFDVVLCDVVEPDGQAWQGCPRTFLRDAVSDVETALAARFRVSFELEFQLLLRNAPPPAMSLDALRALGALPDALMGALDAAGLHPLRFVPEAGPHQFEIPVAAAGAVEAADRSVLVRTLVREVTRRHGTRASFTPQLTPDEGKNGVHIHLSLEAHDGEPLFHAADRPHGISDLAGSFAAGILAHADALVALTAPSPLSYARLRLGERGAGAVALGARNREALIRVPPAITLGGGDPARQLRLEYRGADATANPYLALGALLRAGLEGVDQQLPTPPILELDPEDLDAESAQRHRLDRLPESLADALDALDRDVVVRSWVPDTLLDAFVVAKRGEHQAAQSAPEVLHQRYAAVY